MVLEAAMISIAALCITILHPGMAFKGSWAQATFRYRTSKAEKNGGRSEMESVGSFDDSRAHEMGRVTANPPK